MKILQIATLVPYPPTDGGKLSIFGLIKSLSERGHEIDLVCYQKYADYESSINELKDFCHPHILNFKTDNSIRGAINNLFSKIPYNVSKYYSPLMLKYIIELVGKKDFDIIQINHLHLGWLASYLKEVTKVPVIMRSQNIETLIMKRYSVKVRNPFLKLFSWLQYKKLLKYEPRIYSKFDLCIMISENDLVYLKSKNSDVNAVYIQVGVDDNLLKFRKKTIIQHSIAHIGHTDWYPNFDSLQWFVREIFPKVLKSFPDAILYIYGGGNTKNFILSENQRKNIRVIGFVENLWEHLSEIEVAVVPLRIGGGIRIKILELLASGNVIVTTSVGKEGINVEDGIHLLIADTADEFANKIIRIFNGYETSKIISKGRYFIKENYTWEVIVERFLYYYENIIKKNRNNSKFD